MLQVPPGIFEQSALQHTFPTEVGWQKPLVHSPSAPQVTESCFFGWQTPDPLQKLFDKQSVGPVHDVPHALFSHA